MKYQILNEKIEERGIRKTVIARTLGISERTLKHKIDGTHPLTWEQAIIIQKTFFPDIAKDVLFDSQIKIGPEPDTDKES